MVEGDVCLLLLWRRHLAIAILSRNIGYSGGFPRLRAGGSTKGSVRVWEAGKEVKETTTSSVLNHSMLSLVVSVEVVVSTMVHAL